MKKSITIFVLVTAMVLPSLKDISACFSNKSIQLNKAVRQCKATDHDCMVKQLIKVCAL